MHIARSLGPALIAAALLVASNSLAQPSGPQAPPPPPGAPGDQPLPPPAIGAPPPAAWGAPPPAGEPAPSALPPTESPAAIRWSEGMTADKLPLGERPGIALDTATLLLTTKNGRDNSNVIGGGAIDVATRIRLVRNTFLDLRLPVGLASGGVLVGNPMVGVRHVFVVGESSWITLGGAIGLPLLSVQAGVLQYASFPSALWNLHEYYGGVVPFQVDVAYEVHASFFGFRAQLQPVLYAPITDLVTGQVAIQHAVEIQFGHEFYAGVRLQGVALPLSTNTSSGSNGNAGTGSGSTYVLGLEPFIGLEKRIAFARLGFMIPLNDFLGPPLSQYAGLRLATGARFE
jgi:hypothetical protein